MAKRSQAEIEGHYGKQCSLVNQGIVSRRDAFSSLEHWIVELGNHKLLLNPVHARWFCLNPINYSLQDTGCGIGEALFIVVDNLLGMKKIPEAANVQAKAQKKPSSLAEWHVYMNDGAIRGPILAQELKRKLETGVVPSDSLIFNAAMTEWQRADISILVEAAQSPVFESDAIADENMPSISAKSPGNRLERKVSLTCPECKSGCLQGDLFCANCGCDLRNVEHLCLACGHELFPDDLFCPNCGEKAQ